jgi:hypothetical protein
MTDTHRKRLAFAGITASLAILFLTLPVLTTAGAGAALVVAVSIVCASALIGVVVYVWSANDRSRAARGLPPIQR